MRLDRFLSAQTSLTRSAASEAIRRGAVCVNGTPVRKPDTAVDPQQDAVTLAGKPVQYEQFVYYLLHKPTGVLTAARDKNQPTVLDLIKPEDRRRGIAPSGRLDKDTSGMLLLTDDGQLSHQLISPRHHTAKYYLARLRDPYRPEYAEQFRAGIFLREGGSEEQCLPAECVSVGGQLALLRLREGKYHQVRRMFAAAGNFVIDLLRVQIGALPLPPELSKGAYQKLSTKDISLLCEDSSISSVRAFCMQHYSSYWIK